MYNRLEDGFPLTAAQPTNITTKSTCYSYVGVAPKRKVKSVTRPAAINSLS